MQRSLVICRNVYYRQTEKDDKNNHAQNLRDMVLTHLPTTLPMNDSVDASSHCIAYPG